MNTCISIFSRRGAHLLRLTLLSVLAGCAIWLSLRGQVNHQKTVAPANPLPGLNGKKAVEHLKQEGLYNTLAEAMATARYNADPLPSPDAYQFSNPAQSLRATFTSSGARIVSSPGRRDRELTFKLIGYGYGSRITNLDSRTIVARRNRIEHEYSQSAIRNPQSAIKEWFVNSEAGIEHGFTLPEPPPTARGGDEALRVEIEIGGDFKPRVDAAGQVVAFACGRGGELTYDKLRVYDARERELAARFELDGKRLVIVAEDGEAEYPLTIDPLFTQQAKLTATGGAAEDFFGGSVAIGGDTVVVGASGADIGGNSDQGAAYIFVRNATTTPPSWTQQAKLTASVGAESDFFGASVAIDGDTVVVGAPGSRLESFNHGAAYIFVRNATTTPPSWTQQAKLTTSDSPLGDLFGGSVAIDGDTVVVGDIDANIAPNFGQGAAYIFVRNATTMAPSWTQQAKLMASDLIIFDFFGNSVAIDGDTVVVGASDADAPANDQGAAYIFVRNATATPPSWTQQAKLTASDGIFNDFFGSSVAIDGDTVVVGAIHPGFDDGLGFGKAYIFVRDATTTPPSWTQQQILTPSDSGDLDAFGFSVAIHGGTLVVGAPIVNIIGATYVFVRSGTTWSEQQKLTASDGKSGDFFGGSVAIDGNTVVAGAAGADVAPNIDQGAAYVFVTIAPGAFVTVSAASYTAPVAPKEIVAGFGSSLAAKIAFASSPPFPTVINGTSVIVKDSAGVARDAPLFFVSPSQINYQIPDGTATGEATVSVFIGPHLVAVGPVQIAMTAPSIFALNASGSGPAAALDALTFAPAPFNAELADGMPNFIAVWGTGLGADATDGGGNVFASVKAFIDGNHEAQVTYAGQAPGFQGSNQFNIELPFGITSGEHTLTISRGAMTSNEVTILIQRE